MLNQWCRCRPLCCGWLALPRCWLSDRLRSDSWQTDSHTDLNWRKDKSHHSWYDAGWHHTGTWRNKHYQSSSLHLRWQRTKKIKNTYDLNDKERKRGKKMKMKEKKNSHTLISGSVRQKWTSPAQHVYRYGVCPSLSVSYSCLSLPLCDQVVVGGGGGFTRDVAHSVEQGCQISNTEVSLLQSETLLLLKTSSCHPPPPPALPPPPLIVHCDLAQVCLIY